MYSGSIHQLCAAQDDLLADSARLQQAIQQLHAGVVVPVVVPYSLPMLPSTSLLTFEVATGAHIISTSTSSSVQLSETRTQSSDSSARRTSGQPLVEGRNAASSRERENVDISIGGTPVSFEAIRRMSHDVRGCRLVQEALDDVSNDGARMAIGEAFHGHIAKAITCPHCNHVVQKFLVTMKASSCQFIVEEIMTIWKGASMLARHKYGYRVLQRMFEHLRQCQVGEIIAAILQDVRSLSKHRFGTFVVQHMVTYGTSESRWCIVQSLVPHMAILSSNNDACMVFEAILRAGDQQANDMLLAAMLDSKVAVGAMAHTRRGHVVVLAAFDLLRGTHLVKATDQLLAQTATLKKTRFGRIVLKAMMIYLPGYSGTIGGA